MFNPEQPPVSSSVEAAREKELAEKRRKGMRGTIDAKWRDYWYEKWGKGVFNEATNDEVRQLFEEFRESKEGESMGRSCIKEKKRNKKKERVDNRAMSPFCPLFL